MLVRFRKELHFNFLSRSASSYFYFTKQVVHSFEVELLSLIVFKQQQSSKVLVMNAFSLRSIIQD